MECKSYLPIKLNFFGDENQDSDSDTGADDNNQGNEEKKQPKTFTQEQLDQIIEERLKRERGKQAKTKEVDKPEKKDEAKKDPMLEVNDKLSKLQERTIKAEVKAALLSKDVDPSKIERAYKNVDLSECLEDGEINEELLSKQIEEILKDLPSLKKQVEKDKKEKESKGFKFGAQDSNQLKKPEPTTAREKIANKTDKLFKV